MPKCTMLVGVPASGKSTWRRIHGPGALVASTDLIIESVSNDYGMSYNDAFNELIQFAEKAMWRQITLAHMYQQDYVIDRTNMTAKARKRFIQKLKLHRYEIECIVFPTPEPEEWKRRLDSRPGKTIPQEVLDRMVASYQKPTEEEGFDKITFL